MKNIAKILVAATAVTALASSHAAITTANKQVYITGSTGFRGTVNTIMYSNYSNNIVAWDGGTSGSLANAAAAKNIAYTNIPVTVGGVATNVDVIFAWGGSEAGIQCVTAPANNLKQFPFYDLSKLAGVTGVSSIVKGGNLGLGAAGTNANTTAQSATITFADNTQKLSAFHGGSASSDGISYTAIAAANAVKVAVIPFNFYASKGFPYTNITQNAFYDLASKGSILGNELSGDFIDATNGIMLCGRNVDSGTRQNMQADVHYPTAVNMNQFQVVATNAQMTNVIQEPAGTINGIQMVAGNNGQSSGGTLAKWLTNNPLTIANGGIGNARAAGLPANAQVCYFISYIALVDAGPQYSNKIVPLAYNGIVGRCFNTNDFTNSSVNPGSSDGSVQYLDQGYTNVINGSYPYWGYETMLQNTNNAFGDTTIAGATTNLFGWLQGQITNLSSTDPSMFGAIKLSDMKVKRTSPADGGPVIPGQLLK